MVPGFSPGPMSATLRHDLAKQVDHLGVVGFAKPQVAGYRLPQTPRKRRTTLFAQPHKRKRHRETLPQPIAPA